MENWTGRLVKWHFTAYTLTFSSNCHFTPLSGFLFFRIGNSVVKNLPAVGETQTWVGKIPWRRKWQPTAVFVPGDIPWTEEPGQLQPMGSQRQTRLSE